MNLIPKIAEMLGVEIGEHFNAENVYYDSCNLNTTEKKPTKYRLTNSGAEYYIPAADRWSKTSIEPFLAGHYRIVKLPFAPKGNETYWHVFWYPNKKCVPNCAPRVWYGYDTDFANKCCGNCFRTEEEAEKHKFEIYEKLTGRKWEDE